MLVFRITQLRRFEAIHSVYFIFITVLYFYSVKVSPFFEAFSYIPYFFLNLHCDFSSQSRESVSFTIVSYSLFSVWLPAAKLPPT